MSGYECCNSKTGMNTRAPKAVAPVHQGALLNEICNSFYQPSGVCTLHSRIGSDEEVVGSFAGILRKALQPSSIGRIIGEESWDLSGIHIAA